MICGVHAFVKIQAPNVGHNDLQGDEKLVYHECTYQMTSGITSNT
jgi:hypothetical protein